MKTKKLLSLLLALMMMLSVVPMYASAEAVVLTKDNVVTWPTTSGEIWFGQKLSDGIILHAENALVTSDGTENGTVIPGTWSFADNDFVPTTSGSTARFTLVFTPEDQTAYTGFERVNGRECTCVVNKVTPVFVDEINDPIIATDVEQGATLSTSTLSGGQMKNPYTNEIINSAWKWSSGSTIVNSAGEYNIYFNGGSGYNRVNSTVSVKLIGTAVATTITEAPAVSDMTYGATRNDIVLEGGKAMAGDTEVAGTFTLDYTDDTVMNVGTYNLAITFTPDDTENYLPSTGTATVTVNPAPIKFVDENGADIVPEITVPYGTKLGDRGTGAGFLLKSYINLSEVLYYINFVDSEGNAIDSSTLIPVGTNEYKVKITTDNKNYEDAELTCNLAVEPLVIEITGAGYISATNELYAYIGKTNIPGTFDIFVDGELVGDDLALTYKTVTCPWTPTETGEHTIKVVYNAVNENYVIADYEKAFTAKLQRTLTYDGYIMLSVGFRENATTAVMGDLVTIKPVLEDFGIWVITDANGNEVTLEGVDLTAKEITFTMPDHDVKISFKTNTQLELEEAAENCDHICHSDNPLFQMLWKVLTFIFRLFDVQQYCDCGNLHYDAPLFG